VSSCYLFTSYSCKKLTSVGRFTEFLKPTNDLNRSKTISLEKTLFKAVSNFRDGFFYPPQYFYTFYQNRRHTSSKARFLFNNVSSELKSLIINVLDSQRAVFRFAQKTPKKKSIGAGGVFRKKNFFFFFTKPHPTPQKKRPHAFRAKRETVRNSELTFNNK
jgi:hypothetical protein